MKPRYSIQIKEDSRHSRFPVWHTKHYADHHGRVTGYDSVDECLAFIKNNVLRCWAEYDSIVEREPDPVTLQNTHFMSVTDEITLPLLLGGQQSLSAFEVA